MKFRALPISIRLDESLTSGNRKIPGDIQILRVGNFFYQGKDLPITSEMLSKMVTNFTERVRGIDLAIDYKHDSDDIAAGWIERIYLLNDNKELWAQVNWTPGGEKVLIEKEFRYISADFVLDFVNNETNQSYGPTLFGAGLTNRPFIKDMGAVVELSEQKGTKTMDEKDKQIADLQAQIAALKKQLEDSKDGGADDATEPQMGDMKKQMADLQKANEDLKKENDLHKANAAKAAEAAQLAEKKGKFDKLLTEGKVCEAQREAYMSNDMVKFSENAGNPNLSGSGSSNDKAPIAASTSEQAQKEIIKLAEKHLADKTVKTLSEGQRKALDEHPELYKKIYG